MSDDRNDSHSAVPSGDSNFVHRSESGAQPSLQPSLLGPRDSSSIQADIVTGPILLTANPAAATAVAAIIDRDRSTNISEPANYNSSETTSLLTASSAPLSPGTTVSSSGPSAPENMRSTLSFLQKLGYGLGHVYNDLCAAVWFSYTLLFLEYIINLSPTESGVLVMLGQVCDAIATPIVGIMADRYGTKRRWHIAGTSLVFLSFPMIFAVCPWCDSGYTWWPPVYFAIFIVAFQIAWPIVQISHFSIIPELSKTKKDRADLTATRYSASVIANLVVYMVMWLVLKGRNSSSRHLEPSDARQFRDICLILTLVGLTMAIIFHFSLALSDYEHRRIMSLLATREPPIEKSIVPRDERQDSRVYGTFSNSVNSDTERLIQDQDNTTGNVAPADRTVARRQISHYLRNPRLYQNALLYVFARLFMTSSLVFMPWWLQELNNTMPVTSHFDDSSAVERIATVPLVSFIASFVSSMLMKQANQWLSHGASYLLGSAISVAVCAWLAINEPKASDDAQLYVVAIMFGAGSSVTMVSSLCITADMIGSHTYQGGFVYSAVTFADKLITGIIVACIEGVKCDASKCPNYYRYVLAYVCGVAAILGVLTLWSLRLTLRHSLRAGRTRGVSIS